MRGKILPDDPRHGSANGYNHLGCRCSECRAARAAYQRSQNASRVLRGLPEGDPRHGKPSTYANWGCRCLACKQAAAEYQLAQRARRAVSTEVAQ